MNIYTVTFLFQGEYYFVSFNSNMLANNAVMSDDFAEYKWEHEGEYFDPKIYVKGGREYTVNFNFDDVKHFNVYDEDDSIVEKKIPFIVLKVENENGVIYDITNNI